MGIGNLSATEKLQLLDRIEQEEKELTKLFDETKQADPYWWYKPSCGELSPKGIEFVKQWIRPEDVPAQFYGMDVTFKSNAATVATFGGNQAGKFQPFTSPVLTPSGWVPIGDLILGNKIIGGDGKTKRITGIFDRGYIKCYKFIFDDGSSTIVGEDHLWKCKTRNRRFKRTERPNSVYQAWTVKETKDIIKYGLKPKPRDRISIPVVQPVAFKNRPVPVDPYTLGVLLGDGGLSTSSIILTSADLEIVNYLSAFYKIKKVNSRYAYLISSKSLSLYLRTSHLKGKRSWEKHIPHEYLWNSPSIRLGILQGLMDTDGTISPRCDIEYCTTSPQLAQDVKFLVQSFGGKVEITDRFTFFTYKGVRKRGRKSYRVRIKIQSINPFRLKRKADRFYKVRYSPERVLHEIIPVGFVEGRCISVEDQLYVTDDFIVTHNTLANAVKAHAKITGELPHSLKGTMPDWKLAKKWPVYGRVYGLSNDIIDEVIVPKFREWMPQSYLKKGVWENSYSKQDRILRYYRNGHKFIGQIKFMSCEKDVSKTQGASLWFAHFDEEPPKEFYDECLPRFIANGGKGIDMEFFMTPTNGLTWTHKTLLKKAGNPDANVDCFKIPTLTNPYVDYTTLDKMMQDLDTYDEKKMRILGEFISLSGLIYTGESAIDTSIHVIPPFKLSRNEYIIYRGIDPHLAKPTACVDVAVDRAGFVYVVGTYKKNADTERVKEDLAVRVAQRKYRTGWAAYDKSLDYEIRALGNINIIDQLKRPPNPITAMVPSEKFEGSIKAGIDTIKRYLKLDPNTKKPRLLFWDTPEVWELLEEMQTLERAKGMNESQRGIKDKIKEGPKDLHAAMRYVFQRPLEFIPAERENYNSDNDFYNERYV